MTVKEMKRRHENILRSDEPVFFIIRKYLQMLSTLFKVSLDLEVCPSNFKRV